MYKWIGGDDFGPCSAPVGIEETVEPGEVDLMVYPNPANETVEIRNISEQRMVLILFDLTGKQLRSKLWLDARSTVRVDLQNFPDGIYLIQSVAEDGTVRRQKLVKL